MFVVLEEVVKQCIIEGQFYMSFGGLLDWFCFNECLLDQLLIENEVIVFGQVLLFNSFVKFQEFKMCFFYSNFFDLIELRMSKVGVCDLCLIIKCIECLLVDDEGFFNVVDMCCMLIKVCLFSLDDGDDLLVFYDWDGLF